MQKKNFSLNRLRESAAFSLVELLITLSVFMLILILASPSFKTMLMNTRMAAQSDGLFTALNYARNTALTEATNIQVCPIGATGSASCGGNWRSGWIVVTQPLTGSGILLQSHPLESTDPVLSSTSASITFDTHGLTTTQTNFKWCDTRGGQYGRSIEVLPTGFIQSGASIGQAVWDGSALGCP